ncbi:toxin-antitoxin system HicB family antitoxin [Embleya sp. AB8]|uniref:toxin-antitoxin system HicB family antitoxin n=1 Tax=Embleya sp. AB8 TaxID=3156304 RepID=UPI003C785E7F
MDLTPYVDNLRRELATAAAVAGGAEARILVERLTAPLESAARLTLLNALSAAMAEVTGELAPGSVDIRLRGLDPEFVVTAPPPQDEYAAPDERERAPSGAPTPSSPSATPYSAAGNDGGMARINFRLPAHLKSRIEEAAAREGLSVNAWLVRAVAAADTPTSTARPPRGGGPALDAHTEFRIPDQSTTRYPLTP